jgi:hypothetical protein
MLSLARQQIQYRLQHIPSLPFFFTRGSSAQPCNTCTNATSHLIDSRICRSLQGLPMTCIWRSHQRVSEVYKKWSEVKTTRRTVRLQVDGTSATSPSQELSPVLAAQTPMGAMVRCRLDPWDVSIRKAGED